MMGKTYRAKPEDDFDDHDDFEEEGFYDLSDEAFDDADLEDYKLDDDDFRSLSGDHPHHKNAGHGRPLHKRAGAGNKALPLDWEDFDFGSDASNDDDRYDSRWA